MMIAKNRERSRETAREVASIIYKIHSGVEGGKNTNPGGNGG